MSHVHNYTFFVNDSDLCLFLQANISICMQDLFSAKAKGGSEYYMFIFVIYFVVPVIIISICYTRVFYILYSDISSVEVQNEVRYSYQYTSIISAVQYV